MLESITADTFKLSLSDIQGILMGVLLTIYAGFKTYTTWNNKKLDDKTKEEDKKKAETLGVEYLNLIKTLREEVDRLKEEMEELNVLRLKNRQLRQKIEELEKSCD